jgi:hypothetical protein
MSFRRAYRVRGGLSIACFAVPWRLFDICPEFQNLGVTGRIAGQRSSGIWTFCSGSTQGRCPVNAQLRCLRKTCDAGRLEIVEFFNWWECVQSARYDNMVSFNEDCVTTKSTPIRSILCDSEKTRTPYWVPLCLSQSNATYGCFITPLRSPNGCTAATFRYPLRVCARSGGISHRPRHRGMPTECEIRRRSVTELTTECASSQNK